ncbi:hypothetical protein D0Z07_9084 [Hyphodiscus hymeniophilus]|uniref:Uncharacterized protein n=1 Tax=Hyphodiscus hymeniophilus TaxID=353542 RepID=A0A9P6VD31_9HELO|nr:hypothetical protein D0Z07_9084 [Hyphodiscus hymeniophilus]
MKFRIVSCAVLGATAVTAQHNASTANGCNDGFYPGTDTVIFTTPYTYAQPANGPYEEIHALDLLTIPAANVSFYSDYDGTTATSVCSGAATTFNFTINFCATNASTATAVLHMLHLTDAQTVGVFLGGQNFSTCAALSNGTATITSPPPVVTASGASANMIEISILMMIAGFVLLIGL